MSLTQGEVDRLLALPKRFVTQEPIVLNKPGWTYCELVSLDRREPFLLGLHIGKHNPAKYTLALRGPSGVALVHLDCGGSGVHTNPDGKQVPQPHVQVFVEGDELRIARPLESQMYSDPGDLELTLEQFCRAYNIEDLPPRIRRLV